MGILMKSKPQSRIHRNWSSVVCGRELDGLGEKKSRRLKPFHLGNLFFGGLFKLVSASGPVMPIAAAVSPTFLRNDLLSIWQWLCFVIYEEWWRNPLLVLFHLKLFNADRGLRKCRRSCEAAVIGYDLVNARRLEKQYKRKAIRNFLQIRCATPLGVAHLLISQTFQV